MVSNEERREVAARLRELPIDVYEVEEEWESKGIDTVCHDQTDYYLIHYVLLRCFPADHMHPCDYEELHNRLADLIDRPTAKQEHNGAYWRCSHCGAFTRKDAVIVDGLDVVPLRYCGNCGREWE